jgi:hypothetical protein
MFRTLYLCALFLGITTFSNAQNYSYSFQGEIDSLEVMNLAEKLSDLEGVEVIKARFKVEKSAGEFLIYTNNFKDKTNPYPFDPAKIKAVLIENNLTPLKFKEIPTK